MATGDENDRLRRASDIAFEEGRHRERVEGRLNGHEARLNAINGSIDRAARASGELKQSVQLLHEQVGRMVALQAQRDAVDEARTQQLKEAQERQISNRTFMIGVAAVIATLLVGFSASAHLFGVIGAF